MTIPVTDKGEQRRRQIIEGAADLLLVSGPSGVSHRAVARHVGCSLSATTYYFRGLDDLLAAAGRHNIARWATRAEHAAEAVEAGPAPTSIDDIITAILTAAIPTDEQPLGHYLKLVEAGGWPPVSRAYRTGRDRLNAALRRVLVQVGVPLSPELVMAVVDGAAVSALSEGRDVRAKVREVLRQVLEPALPTV